MATFTAPGFRPRVTPEDTKVWIGGDVSFAIVDRASHKITDGFSGATASLWLTWKNTFAGGRPQAIVLDVTGGATTSFPLGFSEGFAYTGGPAGTYTLAVRATNDAGTSAASDPVSVTFPAVCAGAPGVPVDFIA